MSIIFLSAGFATVGFLLISFVYFISRTLSPIPFFPTSRKDLPLIVSHLIRTTELKSRTHDLVVDLGAGLGTVIFAAAHEAYRKKLPTRFLALDVHPLLILIMKIRRFFHPNKKNIYIVQKDILKTDYQSLIAKQLPPITYHFTIYLYVGHLVIEKIKQNLLSLPKNTTVVSYMYNVPGWEERLVAQKKGVHDLYIYRL